MQNNGFSTHALSLLDSFSILIVSKLIYPAIYRTCLDVIFDMKPIKLTLFYISHPDILNQKIQPTNSPRQSLHFHPEIHLKVF